MTEVNCSRAARSGGAQLTTAPPQPPASLCADNQRCQTCLRPFQRRRRSSPNADAAHWKLHVNLPFLKTAIVALSPSCNLQDSRLGG